MSKDPYYDLQNEVQASLQTASQLRASYARIRNMAVSQDSEELVWARNELKATLATLEADMEDLEGSVQIVESTGARMFGLDDSEVQERRKFVEHVRREVENMRAEVSGKPRSRPPSYASPAPSRPQSWMPQGPSTPPREDEDDQTAWAREEQQMIMRDQDRTMDTISGTLTTLAQQAGLMGQEIGEHVEMLGDLEQGVDRAENMLDSAMNRMKHFMRKSEEKGSGWCIIILIIVLCALVLALILT
ncbi:t-SNARE [Schizophyllum amplum]|uniref:t-SNARE n=1 Tax=Schizophyllum amplum TaxID=97359 RepID=A0A550CG06_9AGAR|nr:t-SNARE [Auriculariopsis ampla]